MQKVLITGGNSGIGLAIAKRLKKLNYDVLTPYSDEMDVAFSSDIKKYIEKNKPNILINCAGFIKPSNIIDSDIGEWNYHFEVNLLGVFICSKYSIENNVNTIINIGSTSALKGRAGWSAYCASKAGVVSLTQSMAEEGINAYCVSPGRANTKMRDDLFPKEDKKTLLDPKEIANVVTDILNNKYNPGDHIVIKKNEAINIIQN